jgi:hypothetical protein
MQDGPSWPVQEAIPSVPAEAAFQISVLDMKAVLDILVYVDV